MFSKRAAQVADALNDKVAAFRQREARHPSRFERAALEREAAADTRHHKTGHGVTDLQSRWAHEAAAIGVTAADLTRSITEAARGALPPPVKVTVAEVIEDLSDSRSAWHRLDVLQAVTDRLRPQPGMSGERWAQLVDRAVERVLDECVDLDPAHDGVRCWVSDGRSMWIEPNAPQVTSKLVELVVAGHGRRGVGLQYIEAQERIASSWAMLTIHHGRGLRFVHLGIEDPRRDRRPGRCRQDHDAACRR